LWAAWTMRRPLRLVCVGFSWVVDMGAQLDLFAPAVEKKRRLAAVMDKLNAKGSASIVRHGHQLKQETK
jgi:DNA polymerase IV